jgi:hypothetical protein
LLLQQCRLDPAHSSTSIQVIMDISGVSGSPSPSLPLRSSPLVCPHPLPPSCTFPLILVFLLIASRYFSLQVLLTCSVSSALLDSNLGRLFLAKLGVYGG